MPAHLLFSNLRFVIFVSVALALTASPLWADEKLPILKVGAEIYSNVTVTTVTATEIYFTSDRGSGHAQLKNLDPAQQKHFKYDPAKAAAAEKGQRLPNQPPLAASLAFNPTIDSTNVQGVMDEAVGHVKAIVNQPVRKFARGAGMEDVRLSQGGWFHPGAIKPDFNNTDVRASQDLNYAQHRYFTSDLNPGVVFLGPEIEFNPMTKYFYVDRSVPKKKLTEPEMLEINRLYRIIGKCEAILSPPPIVTEETTNTTAADASTDTNTDAGPQPNPPMFSRDYLSMHKRQLLIFGVTLLVVALGIRFLTGRARS